MDDASLASAFIAARMGQVQMAVATKMLKMNADTAQSVVKLIDAAQQEYRPSRQRRRRDWHQRRSERLIQVANVCWGANSLVRRSLSGVKRKTFARCEVFAF